MKKNIFIKRILTFWQNLNRRNAILFGVILGVICGIPTLIVGEGFTGLGFLLYFPFHAWLTITLFLVMFSKYERENRLGIGYSFFGAFFVYLFTHKYPLFCLGWFYTMMGFTFYVLETTNQ